MKGGRSPSPSTTCRSIMPRDTLLGKQTSVYSNCILTCIFWGLTSTNSSYTSTHLVMTLVVRVGSYEPWILPPNKSIVLRVRVWWVHRRGRRRSRCSRRSRGSKVRIHGHLSALGSIIGSYLVWLLQLVKVVGHQHGE